MGLPPIGAFSATPIAPTGLPTSAAGASPKTKPDASFSNVIEGLLEKANTPQVQADQALQQLITGETDNVHDVVLSVVKADMSFRLALELRNRLTDAYQEIMRMQV